jgi:ribonuclease P protein component
MLAKTEHFALQAAHAGRVVQEISTADAPGGDDAVDKSFSIAVVRPSAQLGLALVVPKRHAKRAATRNLVKRQMREVAWRRREVWPRTQLLIRQRSAFSPQHYRSAASAALRQAVRSELDRLFAQAAELQ